jgi:hypothetical protein
VLLAGAFLPPETLHLDHCAGEIPDPVIVNDVGHFIPILFRVGDDEPDGYTALSRKLHRRKGRILFLLFAAPASRHYARLLECIILSLPLARPVGLLRAVFLRSPTALFALRWNSHGLVEGRGSELRDEEINVIGERALNRPVNLARDIGLAPLGVLSGQLLRRRRETAVDSSQEIAEHFEDSDQDIELRLRHGFGVGHVRHLKGKGIRKRAGLPAGRENGEGFQIPVIGRADETRARDLKKTGATALLPREFPR